MFSQAMVCATYVDNYIDSVENVPNDLQRFLSRIRDLDCTYHKLLREVEHYYDLWHLLRSSKDASAQRRERAMQRMHHCLIQAQELGDEKMQLVSQMQDLIDQKVRQLDQDKKNFEMREDLQQQQQQGQYHSQHGQQGLEGELLSGGPTPHKQSRLQSPSRELQQQHQLHANLASNNGNMLNLDAPIVPGGNERYSKDGYSNIGGPANGNVERGLYGSSGAASNGTLATSSSGSGVGENQRGSGKRGSRRRNESVLSAMDIGGNESNSTTESGLGGNSGAAQGGALQKRNAASASGGSGSGSGGSASMSTGSGMGGGAQSAGGSAGNAASGSGNTSGKKKKRKARNAASVSAQTNAHEETPPPDTIDPDEPTYCICNQISYGEMILCDNDLCPIEWFHFSCVHLVLKPKGKWFCPKCRGDRVNVMKPKAQFLKELERYNKEKEEKS